MVNLRKVLLFGASALVLAGCGASEEGIEDVEVSYDNKFEEVANEVFGDNLIELTVEEDPEGDPYVGVKTEMQKNLTVESERTGINIDINDFLEGVQDEDFSWIGVYIYTDLVDQYGNAEEYNVVDSMFYKETVDKIDFDNFYFENIPEIADTWIMHSAISE